MGSDPSNAMKFIKKLGNDMLLNRMVNIKFILVGELAEPPKSANYCKNSTLRHDLVTSAGSATSASSVTALTGSVTSSPITQGAWVKLVYNL